MYSWAFLPKKLNLISTQKSVVLFSLAPNCKQPKYPTVVWLNKPWLVYIMAFCLAIKSNDLLMHSTVWMDLSNIFLSEEKLISKRHILYDSICKAFSTQQKYRGYQQSTGCQRTVIGEGDG